MVSMEYSIFSFQLIFVLFTLNSFLIAFTLILCHSKQSDVLKKMLYIYIQHFKYLWNFTRPHLILKFISIQWIICTSLILQTIYFPFYYGIKGMCHKSPYTMSRAAQQPAALQCSISLPLLFLIVLCLFMFPCAFVSICVLSLPLSFLSPLSFKIKFTCFQIPSWVMYLFKALCVVLVFTCTFCVPVSETLPSLLFLANKAFSFC